VEKSKLTNTFDIKGTKASKHQGIKASRHQGIKASRHQGIDDHVDRAINIFPVVFSDYHHKPHCIR